MSLPPIHYGNATPQTPEYEVRFEGILSIERTEPYYVFQMDTTPCFPTRWRIHPRIGTPVTRKEAEKRLESKISSAPGYHLDAVIKKIKDCFWLTVNPSGPHIPELERVMDAELKFLERANALVHLCGDKTLTPAGLLKPLPGNNSKCALEILIATEEGRNQCTEFMIGNPEWWPLAEAIQAHSIMTTGPYDGISFSTTTWLGHVIIAELELRAIPAAKIRDLVGLERFLEDDGAIIELLTKHRITAQSSPGSDQLSLLLGGVLKEKGEQKLRNIGPKSR